MSLHFLIDGYNVIKQVECLKDLDVLRDARASLVRIIQSSRLMKSKNNQATIVFDGKGDFNFCRGEDKGSLKTIFSKGESADETTKRIVNDVANPKQMVVVTDDKAIIFFIRSLGAKRMSVSEFLGGIKRRLSLQSKQKGRKNPESLKTEITYQQQEAINQELREYWK